MKTYQKAPVDTSANRFDRRAFMGVTVTAPAALALPTLFTPRASLAAANDDKSPLPPPPTAPASGPWVRKYPQLEYRNQYATRNLPCTNALERSLIFAACAVYGADVVIEIYSGGQPAKGTSGKRIGSIRHDDRGHGGRAADIRVRRLDGTLIAGPELARLGQYWLAVGWGGVGFEMNQNGVGGGGLHLDEWARPPPGGGMLWFYGNSRKEARASGALTTLEGGLRGIYPA